MRDPGVGVLNPEQLTELTLMINETTTKQGAKLLTITEHLVNIDKRLDVLTEGQLHLVARQTELRQDARDRDLRIGKFRAEMRERLDRLEHDMSTRFEAVDERFTTIDHRFDAIDERFDQMRAETNGKFDAVQGQLNRIAEAVGVGSSSSASRTEG